MQPCAKWSMHSAIHVCMDGGVHELTNVFYISTDRGLKPFRFCDDPGRDERNRCSNEDGGTFCSCSTDLCNADKTRNADQGEDADSLAVRFLSNWNTLIAFGFLVLTITL